jgi:hypothetical protein
MSRNEQKELLKNMRQRTKKATVSKQAAIDYLVELGMMKKDGSFSKTYLELCTKSKAA